MVYFAHSLTSPELMMEFVEEYEGYFYYRLYRDQAHPIFIKGLINPEESRTSYALIYHKEKGFRFMEESDLFKRAYDVDPGLFFMIDFARAKQKCNDKTPPPGLLRSYTSNKFDDAKMTIAHTRKLLKQSPRFNLNGLRLGQTKKEAFMRGFQSGKYQFYNNLVVTPIATHYHSPSLDLDLEEIKEIGKRKRTIDDMGMDYFPQNYASSAEYYIQCGDHALSITYANGYFY